MNDTSEKMAAMIAERHRQMTPEMRLRIASQMFDTARAIVESSLPAGLSDRDRRLALIERLYGDELPSKAKLAFAAYDRTFHSMSAIEAAALAGIDLSVIDENLRLTPEQRALQHQAGLEMAFQLEATYRASHPHDGNQSTSEKTPRS